MAKKILVNGLKAVLAAGLLWWLMRSGKLDWHLLADMRRYPHRLLLAFLFCFVNLFLITWRWRQLLGARGGGGLNMRQLFFVNWIGQFFSIVLPGSVTGDLAKVYYVKRRDPTFSNAFLLFSCFLDRLMGLTGLILLMGTFSVFHYGPLTAMSPRLAPLLHFNFLLLAGVGLAALVFFFMPTLPARVLARLSTALPQVRFLPRLHVLWDDLVAAKGHMAKAVFVSILVQFLGVVIFHLLVSPQYTAPLSLSTVLSFIPLGFMAVAVPLAPAGLGVGHAAFEALFGFAGQPGGANFFNMYFVVVVAFGLLGALPWIIWRGRESS